MEYVSKSEKETCNIAKKLALEAKPGDIFALYGDLGSGKTTFTKGIASAFGIKKPVTSPTFVISKEYPVNTNKIKKLVHTDCYRLSGKEDAENIGLPEYLNCNNAVVVLEWPEKIENMLPKHVKKIEFEYIDENTRKLTVGNQILNPKF